MARSDVAVFHLSLKCKKLLPLERTYTQVNNSSIIASPQHHMHAQFLFVPWPPIIAPVVSKFEKNEPFFILEQRGLTPGHRRGHARSVTATWDGRRGRGYHSHLYSPNWCCEGKSQMRSINIFFLTGTSRDSTGIFLYERKCGIMSQMWWKMVLSIAPPVFCAQP